MMQRSAAYGSTPFFAQAIGQAPDGAVLIALEGQPAPVAAATSARFDADDVRRFTALRYQVLVVMADHDVPVIVDFIAPPHTLRPTWAAKRILRCDALELGGQARLWADGRTLHVRAFHMDLRAEGEQRLRGATVHVG
jgi:hypothetical protein